ncbi:hypothetical protein Tco_1020161 [Tanacetum coccineum]|uniref:Uncharacterized protein n=1 Tax=Tanacetum coccineum TaxID=301880 RepID=A0ABQ5FZG6_9ASTR
MDFLEFYKELEAEYFGAGAKLMGLQFLQLEFRLEKTSSRSFRPIKSAEILCKLDNIFSETLLEAKMGLKLSADIDSFLSLLPVSTNVDDSRNLKRCWGDGEKAFHEN